jgi:hypothetical protein
VCHQTASLIARAVEAAGIPTVVVGSAFDILQRGNPARVAYVDYPLGHSCGKPFDEANQLHVMHHALRMLHDDAAAAPGSGGVVQPLCVGQWTDLDEDTNLTIGGGGMGESGIDTRQPRDDVRRYQAAEDLTAELPWDAGDETVCVVSPEALRQAAIKAEL